MTATTRSKYWRSLEELQDTPEFREFLHREFPVAASEFPEGVSRRRWMQLMGASLALGGLAGCRWEEEKIAPFAVRPENRVPGEAEYFATTIEIGGVPQHLLVTCYDGRPIKIEGNPEHPACRGASDSLAQASILNLYDPDRSDSLRQTEGRQSFTRSWQEFEAFVDTHFSALRAKGGEGFRILAEPTSSMTTRALYRKVAEQFPKAKIHHYAALSRANESAGTKLAFGEELSVHYDLSQARILATFDEDLLSSHPESLRHARDFASGRTPGPEMSRIYAVESQFSTTGIAADHRLPLQSHKIGQLLVAVDTLVRKGEEPSVDSAGLEKFDPETAKFVVALASDLLEHPGASVIAVGPAQPAEVHAIAHGLNSHLANVGKTVSYRTIPPVEYPTGSLTELVEAMRDGQVESLVILGGNPVYDAPGDLKFAEALAEVETSIHLSAYEDETSTACAWHLPQADSYESWGDVKGRDGSICVTQPLIAPLLDGKSSIEVLALLCGDPREPQEIVKEAVAAAFSVPMDNQAWRKLLHDGFVASNKPIESSTPAVTTDRQAWIQKVENAATDKLEVVFTASPGGIDGRFANNGWLQETPDSLTKMTWDNAAIVSPKTATDLGLSQGTVIQLTVGETTIEIPAFTLPGQAEGSIGLALGYGRTAAGSVGGQAANGTPSVGVDVNVLRKASEPHFLTGVKVSATGTVYQFATTQDHHAIDTVGLEETGRRVGQLVREGTVDEYEEHPDFAQHMTHHPPLKSLWEEPEYEGHAWGMSIDLNKCIGCNACMVACQSENNVPIVGKDQVAKGREMHWIRVDRYFEGEVDNPSIATQPVACHHCETAPCEQVCPVAATVHSDEGLNDMVYNRCIGTRYCANNCPYKVRRFNFLDYNEPLEEANKELVQLVVNPEVTVRSRGVMEKCTYCVQRIQSVKIDAKNERRPIADGEIKSACQQACPTQAIEFGDLNNPESRVAAAHADSRAYGMLSELNVKPRTKYLARIRNPHPLLAASHSPAEHHHGGHHGHS